MNRTGFKSWIPANMKNHVRSIDVPVHQLSGEA